MQIVPVHLNPARKDQIVHKHLKQTSVVDLSMRFDQLLQLVILIAKRLNLVSLLQYFHLKLLDDLGTKLLVLAIHVLNRLLDDIR